ncbi:MAG: Nramp family divalent metal transporter [Flavobacteriales bacterium]|nr:Nramp family divalent metal transporter [Flavobacteriales bacterium]
MKKFIQSILPGLFLIGFNIGTGSVTAMAKAGANYGMALLWTILLSCLVTYYLIRLFGKYTIVTGETALAAFRKHIHPAFGMFLLVALTVNVSGGIMGVMGIVADVLHHWSLTWIDGGISPLIWASGSIALIYGIFLIGTTSTFEKALAGMVAFMGLCFFINFVLMMPPVADMLNGLIPQVPETNAASNSSSYLVIAGMVGTTVSSMIFIVRTTLVKEAGWGIQDMKIQNRDALVSATMMFLISASIMAAAAGTLYLAGYSLNDAKEMITLLEPVAGKYAVAIFVVGITAAGLSSQFPNTLLLPWLICDYFSIKPDMKRTDFRIVVLVMSLLGLVVPIFHARPVFVMVASQAFAALVLPVTVGGIFYLTSRKQIMGEHVNSKMDNLILFAIFLFSLFMGGVGVRGFIQDFL